VLLHGKDPYQLTGWTRKIIETLHEAEGEEVERFDFDGKEVDLATVLDELRSYGLIQRHKVVVLDNAADFLAGQDQRRDAMERYAANPVDSATLILRSETWRKGNLDKAIAKVGMIHQVEAPTPAVAAAWCRRRADRDFGVSFAPEAADTLVQMVGPDLGRLSTEVDKLAAAAGEGGTITRATIAELVGISREEKVWALQSLILSGRGDAVGAMFHELMDIGQQPMELMTWSVTDMLRKLHGVSRLTRQGVPAGAINKQLKLWGQSIRTFHDAAGRFEPGELSAFFDRAIRMDQHNKSGRGDPRRSLEVLTLQIADKMKRTAGSGDRRV
ncbi:MAG: DNA polymerase III subunit delta, partial [Phycisphaerales bacterium]